MSRTTLVFLTLFLGGCTYVDERSSAANATVPTKRVVRYMPPADQYVKSKLIDFDSPYDVTFVLAKEVRLVDDPEKAGNRVLIAPSTQIKLSALVRGREFPGQWDLLGVRIRADRKVPVRLSIASSGAAPFSTDESNCEAHWKIHWVELRKLPTSLPSEQELLLEVKSLDSKPVLVDDVILAQSHTVLSQSIVPVSGESWVVRRSALRWQVLAGDRELLTLPAAPFVEQGYRVAECNPVRTVFTSSSGTIAIDRNGRYIENGVSRIDPIILKFAKTTAENQSPANIEVPGDQGRVDRNLPGDLDNDGYDETRGCYTVRATTSRVNIKLTPQKSPVKWPVIEVVGLPPGTVSVWIEGQSVPWVTRLSDGKTIIELPVTMERGIEVQIRVK